MALCDQIVFVNWVTMKLISADVKNAKAIDSFSAEKNKVYSSLISEFMKKELDIDPSHCIIHFQNLDAGNVGCCSTTMQELLKK